MDSTASGLAALGTIAMLFSVILAILWILVPFAIFGIKPLLRDLIREQQKTYAALATVSQQIHTASLLVAPPVSPPTTALEIPPQRPSDGATLAEILREEQKPKA